MKLPEYASWADDVMLEVVEDPDYDPWTVADIVEMLKYYPQDKALFIQTLDEWGNVRVKPIDMIGGNEGYVSLF